MRVEVRKGKYSEVKEMRELYRQECNCQIVHDSALVRKLADPYLVYVDGALAGYGAVWNKIDPGRLTEFYTLPRHRVNALGLIRGVLAASAAREIETQTNIASMMALFFDCAQDVQPGAILFQDAGMTQLPCPKGTFRAAAAEDVGAPDQHADWAIECDGRVVASGGFLCHYNPPYGDVYMSVAEEYRRQGFGSYMVQEVKRVCYETGKRPSARCNERNAASRRTLEKAGFLPCGRLLVGKVKDA